MRTGKIDPVQGLEAVNFKFEEHALDNGVHNELNKCFCREGEFIDFCGYFAQTDFQVNFVVEKYRFSANLSVLWDFFFS